MEGYLVTLGTGPGPEKTLKRQPWPPGLPPAMARAQSFT